MTIALATEVERLARKIAEKTGATPENEIKEAVEERARALGVNIETPPERFDEAAVRAIMARVAARPVLDNRTPDEIIGYNEYGVPE